MKYLITKDQCYCSFGDGIVYTFFSHAGLDPISTCQKCAFHHVRAHTDAYFKCLYAPCQKGFRHDKNDGYWQISNTIDYQVFTKMMKIGG